MAKVTITNLNTLLDGVVTGNIAVQTAQAAVTQSSTNASIAAASALSAVSSKNEVDSQVLAAQAIANDISDDVVSNELIKDFITDLETAVRAMAESVEINKDEAQDILDDVITKYSAVLVRYNMINALVTDFHTKYLGASLEAPNASWEGMELATGMIYYDTAKNSLMIWVNTNKWVPIIEAVNVLLATNNLADLLDKEAARVNLNVYSREETITLLEEQDEASEIAFDGTVSGLAAENVQSAVDEIIAQKAQPSGIASLDVNGHVPSAQLPSYVDDVIEVATYADLPITGETDKIYVVVTDENSGNDTSSYRWTGTAYAMVSNTLTAADVKALYESNLDTNAYTDAEKTKLSGIATGATATVNINDLTDVIILTPASGEVLKYTGAEWVNGASTGSSATISETPPLSPSSGDKWFNSTTGVEYLYYTDGIDSAWVDITGNQYGVGATVTPTQIRDAAVKTSAVTSENISGHTVVSLGSSGTVQVCDSSAQVAVLGITNNSALTGGTIEIITNGLMTFAGWNFDAGKPVFCNSTGQLTTTQPATIYQTIVGVANSQTSLIINIQPQINIGA